MGFGTVAFLAWWQCTSRQHQASSESSSEEENPDTHRFWNASLSAIFWLPTNACSVPSPAGQWEGLRRVHGLQKMWRGPELKRPTILLPALPAPVSVGFADTTATTGLPQKEPPKRTVTVRTYPTLEQRLTPPVDERRAPDLQPRPGRHQ